MSAEDFVKIFYPDAYVLKNGGGFEASYRNYGAGVHTHYHWVNSFCIMAGKWVLSDCYIFREAAWEAAALAIRNRPPIDAPIFYGAKP